MLSEHVCSGDSEPREAAWFLMPQDKEMLLTSHTLPKQAGAQGLLSSIVCVGKQKENLMNHA